MASAILHIKDSYYFEVPKPLWRAEYKSRSEFPDVWVSLDPDYQKWEAEQLIHSLETAGLKIEDHHALEHEWEHWQHADHANHGKPFFVFLEEKFAAYQTSFASFKSSQEDAANLSIAAADAQVQKLLSIEAKPSELKAAREKLADAQKHLETTKKLTLADYLKTEVKAESAADKSILEFAQLRTTEAFTTKWLEQKSYAGRVATYKKDSSVTEWSEAKLAGYNNAMSGKILIPQPFGELRNFYEPYDGICISRFMVIELIISMILIVVFTWLASRLTHGSAPKGRLWNLLETFVIFIRDQVATPAFGGDHGHDDHGHGDHGHGDHGHGDHAHSDHGHDDHGHKAHGHTAHGHAVAHAAPVSDAVRYTPILCTIFFFILACNLFGMLPWLGAPTGSFSVTLGLAAVTFFTGMVMGVRKFGALGYLANQIPSMDLPLPIAIVLKPMIFVIEVGGLLIKHVVLAIRLLANMFAGHMVLLGILGLAFGLQAATTFGGPDGNTSLWTVAAVSSVVGSALLSLLELFVCFLQAYVFTLLSALFIAGAIHKH